MTMAMAESLIGSLSHPSKMPGWGWGISTAWCNVGRKLVNVANAVCKLCYADRGHYKQKNVQAAHTKRLLASSRVDWSNLMAFMINFRSKRKGGDVFRWFDSGDLQSVELLTKICQVCEQTPNVKHYLPTKEYGIVSDFVKQGGVIPDNLCIRLSAYMIDGPLPLALSRRLGVQTAMSVRQDWSCPAHEQGNKCLDCRKCWDRSVEVITYKLNHETKEAAA